MVMVGVPEIECTGFGDPSEPRVAIFLTKEKEIMSKEGIIMFRPTTQTKTLIGEKAYT